VSVTATRRPRLLDLFCGAGGCSVGYRRAGFDVTGVDVKPHPDYPFPMIVGDAMSVLRCPDVLDAFDVVAASPPCPRYSTATPTDARENHPDLVGPVRELLRSWGGVYVIENVPGAPLVNPIRLCGSTFGLGVRRHRLFETSPILALQPACLHEQQPIVHGVYGDHADRPGGWLRPDGTSRGVKATSVEHAQELMGIDWMECWEDLADAIPPAYTEYLGAQLIELLAASAQGVA